MVGLDAYAIVSNKEILTSYCHNKAVSQIIIFVNNLPALKA